MAVQHPALVVMMCIFVCVFGNGNKSEDVRSDPCRFGKMWIQSVCKKQAKLSSLLKTGDYSEGRVTLFSFWFNSHISTGFHYVSCLNLNSESQQWAEKPLTFSSLVWGLGTISPSDLEIKLRSRLFRSSKAMSVAVLSKLDVWVWEKRGFRRFSRGGTGLWAGFTPTLLELNKIGQSQSLVEGHRWEETNTVMWQEEDHENDPSFSPEKVWDDSSTARWLGWLVV